MAHFLHSILLVREEIAKESLRCWAAGAYVEQLSIYATPSVQ